MIQADSVCVSRVGRAAYAAPQTTERSRTDAAQRHWKAFDDTSFCVWFRLADLVSNACCDI